MKVALLAQADVSLGNIKTRVLRTFPLALTRAAVEAASRAGIKIIYLKMGFLPDLADLGAEDVPEVAGSTLLCLIAPLATSMP